MNSILIVSKEDIDEKLKFLRHKIEELNFPVECLIQTWIAKRSLPQNALLHRWFRTIAEWCNEKGIELKENGVKKKWRDEDAKLLMKRAFLGTKQVEVNGKMYTSDVSTADLNVSEMFDFMVKVETWAIDKGISLHVPEGCEYEALRDKNA